MHNYALRRILDVRELFFHPNVEKSLTLDEVRMLILNNKPSTVTLEYRENLLVSDANRAFLPLRVFYFKKLLSDPPDRIKHHFSLDASVLHPSDLYTAIH